MASDLSGAAPGPNGNSDDAPPIEAVVIEPVMRREVIAVALWTLLADLLIYRTFGFSGPAVFFATVPLVFFIGCPALRARGVWRLTAALLVLVAVRMFWAGSGLMIFSGLVLVVALAMQTAGYVPLVLEGLVLAGRAIYDGAKRLGMYRLPQRAGAKARSSGGTLSWMLPVIAASVFGSIFVFANPDLFHWVSIRISRAAERFQLWLQGLSFWEIPFCVLALLIGAGLMRPALPLIRIGPMSTDRKTAGGHVRSPLFAGYRNSLITLIGLFAVYLVFEFMTLWKRDFPPGFYYAGYAHQGAAWLTFALGLATVVLSLVFSGATLRDDRLGFLHRLAWIWSIQNFLLAAAVYNRLLIYVGYNGMTRLRTVAFFGITVVVIGFILVLLKIRRDHGFWWLIRAQLIALTLTIIAYSAFPVDYLVHRYNAAVVSTGYLHPSVMIAVKPKIDEGLLPLLKLTECDDPIVRDGVLAMLAQREIELDDEPVKHWTQFQVSREFLRRRLKQRRSEWSQFQNQTRREDAISAFRNYAMQWY